MLYERFTAVTEELMVARGWSPSDEMGEGRFCRPLPDGFVATAMVAPSRGPIRGWGQRKDGSGEPPLGAYALVGVSYPAAERLLRAAGAAHQNAAIEADVGDLLSPPRDVSVRIEKPDQIASAVESLVLMVDQHAEVFAAERASADALIASAQADPPEYAAEIVPALLAAFGRTEEARAALAKYEAAGVTSQYFSRQLARILDGEITLEELESAPDT